VSHPDTHLLGPLGRGKRHHAVEAYRLEQADPELNEGIGGSGFLTGG